MSTLEKTIDLISRLPERQIENIYSYAQFVSSKQKEYQPQEDMDLDEILDNIIGVLPDEGKTLEEYREERIKRRYEFAD